MTKADLVREIALATGYDRNTVLDIVEAMMATVKTTVAQNEEVSLRGFGTFTYKVRKQKVARNICQQTTIIVPEHNIPVFKPSKEFNNNLK